ncbi:MAG: hypothetical protein K8U03_13075 [Planctomycetia bacterium]|nr:hypothetical protein [Planctomycetia bacterium]
MRHAGRLRSFVGLSLVAILSLQAVSFAQRARGAEVVETDETIAELVRELDAPQKARREEAERKLIAIGPSVVERLPKPGPSVSAEVVGRLNRVRAALYRARAEASVHASTITLAVKDASLAQVFAEIEKQTGNHLVDFRRQFGQQAADLRLTLDMAKQPFWKALDAVAEQAGMEVYHFAGEDGLALVAAPQDKAKPRVSPHTVSYSEAFRIEARRVTASRNPAVADGGELRVELEVAWEPRLKPLFLTSKMSKVAAIDDRGEPIAPGNAELATEIPPQGKACRAEIALSFKSPPRSAQAIKTLRGTLDVLLPAELHTFRFTKLNDAGRQEQRAAAVTVAIEEPRKNNDLVQIALALKYENPANALESHRAWFYKNPCYLEAADGTKTPPGTIELTRQSNDELMLNLLFAPDGDWTRQTFVYQTPADIVVLPVVYEFSDLPLP